MFQYTTNQTRETAKFSSKPLAHLGPDRLVTITKLCTFHLPILKTAHCPPSPITPCAQRAAGRQLPRHTCVPQLSSLNRLSFAVLCVFVHACLDICLYVYI